MLLDMSYKSLPQKLDPNLLSLYVKLPPMPQFDNLRIMYHRLYSRIDWLMS